MKRTPFLISGMYRSGTTLLTKMLNAHPACCGVDDPFFQFFKAFRNELAVELYCGDFDLQSPIDEHFDSPYPEVINRLQGSDFKIPFRVHALDEVIRMMLPFCRFYCPELEGHLSKIKANTYAELLVALLDLSRQTYGQDGNTMLGCKNTFCEAFAFPFLQTFPSSQVLIIIRDPRAVLGSQNAAGDNGAYPVLFALRHWRKSVACAIILKTLFPDRATFVKYEDLIDAPDKTSRELCRFLNLPYDPAMVHPENFRGKGGKPWMQNSSFGTSQTITNRFADRWKEVLSPEQVAFTENLCKPEMIFLGYKRISNVPMSDVCLQRPEFKLKIQEWFQPYENRYEINSENLKKESDRLDLLKKPFAPPPHLSRERLLIFQHDFLADKLKLIDSQC